MEPKFRPRNGRIAQGLPRLRSSQPRSFTCRSKVGSGFREPCVHNSILRVKEASNLKPSVGLHVSLRLPFVSLHPPSCKPLSTFHTGGEPENTGGMEEQCVYLKFK